MNMINTNTSTLENEGTETKKKEFVISITEPADFDACEELRVTTAKELSTVINSIFVNAYNDYVGAQVALAPVPVPGNQAVMNKIIAYLFFEIFPPKAYDDTRKEAREKRQEVAFAFSPALNGDATMLEKLTVMSGTNGGIRMTDEGKEGLARFVNSGAKTINWSTYTRSMVMGGHTYVAVSLTSLNVLLAEAYGKFDEEGSKYDYDLQFINSITQDQTIRANAAVPNFIINIKRLKTEALNRAADLAGIITFDNAQVPPMVRAR